MNALQNIALTAREMPTHALLRTRRADISSTELVSLHRNYDLALQAWAEADNNGNAAWSDWFFSVRELDHPMTVGAIEREAAKLPPKERETLTALAPFNVVRPAYTPSYRGPHPTCLVRPATRLANKGLLRMSGVKYGPKTYQLTSRGRLLAAVLMGAAEAS